MADGIRINDAALEISPQAIQSLIKKDGQPADITLSRLDLTVSPQALAALLQGLSPEGAAPPSVTVEDGRLQAGVERDGRRVGLDLRLGGVRISFTAEGLRITGE